jgi:hypothetical protein
MMRGMWTNKKRKKFVKKKTQMSRKREKVNKKKPRNKREREILGGQCEMMKQSTQKKNK